MQTATDQLPDLTICDLEPITRLDLIQNFGFLTAMSNDWTIIRASENLVNYMGIEATSAIGENLSSIISSEAQIIIRDSVCKLFSTGNERLFGVPLRAGFPPFDINLHYVDGVLVLEGEPSRLGDSNVSVSIVRSMMTQLNLAPDRTAFQNLAVRRVRDMTGFDRVMIYRFEPNGDGEVVAESMVPNIGSFLGLHYPATDIPQQARALYLRNPFRIISDVGETPVALFPRVSAMVSPLDLSQAITRAVSPVHIEYLSNMGVGATLSISIIVGGELWGLFACHHYAPRLPSFAIRTAAELFGGMYSMALESRLSRDGAATERSARAFADRLIIGIAGNELLLSDVKWLNSVMNEMVEYDGIAIYRGGAFFVQGAVPDTEDIKALTRQLILVSPSHVFHTDHLTSIVTLTAASSARVSGVLAIPISRSPRDYILLFRREWVHSIRWAGEHDKVAKTNESLFRLSPRKSFAEFTASIVGKSRPWSLENQAIGEALRTVMTEVVLRMSETANAGLADEIDTRRLMASAIAHEINQPLAAAANYVSAAAALAAKDPTDPEAMPKIVNILCTTLEQVSRAGDLLKVLRQSITRDETPPTRESIRSLIADTVASARHDCEGLGITIRIGPPGLDSYALVNRNQIRQVLANLLLNAVEAVTGTERRNIMVSETASSNNGMLTVSVSDTGPGVCEDYAKAPFRPFVSMKPHGMGIGLSISREIIEKHGGIMTMGPNPGGGSVFSFTLPLAT